MTIIQSSRKPTGAPYGRCSTEDNQDPETSHRGQLGNARNGALRGPGRRDRALCAQIPTYWLSQARLASRYSEALAARATECPEPGST
jgi:hypothetical protein